MVSGTRVEAFGDLPRLGGCAQKLSRLEPPLVRDGSGVPESLFQFGELLCRNLSGFFAGIIFFDLFVDSLCIQRLV
jgi:hypothetical protein